LTAKSILFSIFYYISALNWKIDVLDSRNVGIIYIILFIIPPFIIPFGMWICIIWIAVIPRSLYLLGIIDYILKKVEK